MIPADDQRLQILLEYIDGRIEAGAEMADVLVVEPEVERVFHPAHGDIFHVRLWGSLDAFRMTLPINLDEERSLVPARSRDLEL
jgi:hypothetical protein